MSESATANAPAPAAPPPALPDEVRIPGLRFRLRKEGQTRRRIELEVPAPVYEGEMLVELRKIRRRARIPGFRRGRVPMPRIRQLYGDTAAEEAARRLLSRALRQSVHDLEVAPIETPRVRLPELPRRGPLRAELRFEVMPELGRIETSGIELTRRKTEVGEEDIARTLERLRLEKAQPGPLRARGIQDGDIVIGDLEEFEVTGKHARPAPGAPSRKTPGLTIQAGSAAYHPALHEALQGARPGDTVVSTGHFRQDSPDPDRAGRTLRAIFTVKDGRSPVLPPVDDALAREFGADSLLALRGDIRDRLREQAARDDKAHLEGELLKTLAERHPVEAPRALVNRDLTAKMRAVETSLAKTSGREPSAAEVEEAIRPQLPRLRAQAERAVRDGLLLDAVCRQENIPVPKEAVEAVVAKLAGAAGKTPDAIRANLELRGVMGTIEEQEQRRAAVSFLLERVELKDPEPESPTSSAPLP